MMGKLKTPARRTESSPGTRPALDLKALRTRRISDYLEAALANPDPLVANLGAVHGDLLQMQQRPKGAMDKALSCGEAELSDFNFLLPGLDHLLRLAKQIDCFSQLELQLKSAERKSSAPQRHPVKSGDTSAAAVERSPSSEE